MGEAFKSSVNSFSLIPKSSKFAKSALRALFFNFKAYSISLSIDFLSSDAKNSYHSYS